MTIPFAQTTTRWETVDPFDVIEKVKDEQELTTADRWALLSYVGDLEGTIRRLEDTPVIPTVDAVTQARINAQTGRPRPLTLADWEMEAQQMTEEISVIPTPFPTLNDICRRGGGRQGWRLGWHIVLAGAPGFGKTTVAMNAAVHAAMKGKRVGIISLEMGKDEIMAIMLSIATRTHEKELEAIPGKLNETFRAQARTFQDMLAEAKGAIYLIDLPRSDLVTIEKAIKQMIEDGCELIVIDYMQRITVAGKSDDYGRMTDISNTLQGMAKQEKIVTLALSQFNRGTSGGSYTPKAQGLKGSSALEDDANFLMVVDHTRYHRRPDGSGADFVLAIGKNRHGPLGDINLFMSYGDMTVTERI